MYDSRNPRAEFRQAKEAFEDALALAGRMGRKAEESEIAERLRHVKAVFLKQFDR
jgi:hypothetical protein